MSYFSQLFRIFAVETFQTFYLWQQTKHPQILTITKKCLKNLQILDNREFPEMTLDEINEEIRLAREDKKQRQQKALSPDTHRSDSSRDGGDYEEAGINLRP